MICWESIRHQKEKKTQGNKYKCENKCKCVDVDKELSDYMTNYEEDTLDQSREIEELSSTLERYRN